ncbi:CLUMA_CG010065, isoform A [Clunio marinus]|uniref:CLUMA_CG010065, isoform A n=1 Tax=Clunio marinus TaxID=568069 RepID=A0A1J1I8P5_9DIPT|nr:CLUMA_CG010065, isoform A [Clunio marinus]
MIKRRTTERETVLLIFRLVWYHNLFLQIERRLMCLKEIDVKKISLVVAQKNFSPQNYGQSSALANANAFNQYQGPGGFGGSAANAGAQSFNSQGPLGGFGASAANSQTQGFHAGPNGFSGSAGLSGSQTYNLPGGQSIDLAYGGSYSNTNGQAAGGNSHSINYNKG